MNRRKFLQKIGVGAAACVTAFPNIVPSAVLGKGENLAPSERVTLGCIGVGGRGGFNMKSLLHHGAQIVAICDVNKNRRLANKYTIENFYANRDGKGKYKGCATYNDFRELISQAEIDAVMIATPDHWHVPIALEAVKYGKDIYVEKPLGMTIAECQVLRDAVKRYRVVFQHGTEQRAMSHFRWACELIRNGRIGELEAVKVGAPGGNRTGNHKPESVPAGLDYEMWLGPAPRRPFTTACCLRNGHWFISDFAASGFIAGWGIHYMDIVQWALDADESGPVEIEGRAVFPKDGLFDTPLTWNIDYLYANGIRVNFTDQTQNRHGIRFEGTEGWIQIARNGIEGMQPRSLYHSAIRPNEIHLYETDSDDKDFLHAVRTRGRTCSPIDAAHRSTSVCFLGNIACLLNRKLRWDPVAELFVNNAEANRMLIRTTRTSWKGQERLL
jgi:predicted dehydrogenase